MSKGETAGASPGEEGRSAIDGATPSRAPIGWGRAALETLAIFVVGVGVLVYGTNMVLTKLTGLSGSARVGIATAGFFVFLLALAWVLRWLQHRHMI